MKVHYHISSMTHAYSSALQTPEKTWDSLHAEAARLRQEEPALALLLQSSILPAGSLADALCRMLSGKLASAEMDADMLLGIFSSLHHASPGMADAACHDLAAIMKNDPAARDILTPFLFFKGFHALQSYRLGHALWRGGRRHLALHVQNRISDLFGVDIHPAARIGSGVMMDHATGIVIGETALVEDGVLFWHGVTLGGKGRGGGDRHPKVRQGVMLGAGATLLGPIDIGANARVAAGSVVIRNVAANATVAGVPARVIAAES